MAFKRLDKLQDMSYYKHQAMCTLLSATLQADFSKRLGMQMVPAPVRTYPSSLQKIACGS